MRKFLGAMTLILISCAPSTEPTKPAQAEKQEVAKVKTAPASVVSPTKAASPQAQADEFLQKYYQDFSQLEAQSTRAYWQAANTGTKEDFNASAEAELALRMLHSDKARYEQIKQLLTQEKELSPIAARSLQVAELSFKGNQLPKDVLAKMAKGSADIEQTFSNYVAEIDGQKKTANDLLEILSKEKNSAKRQRAWEASKEVGAQVAAKIVELAKVRNAAAKSLGYKNYWEMQIKLQEHDPAMLIAIFDELEKLTNQPFFAMKAKLDGELAKKFKIKPEQIMPWHYDNPFFQAAPPSVAINLDVFFKDKKKEDIVKIAQKFYDEIGLDIAPIVAKSDFYERPGKNPHAFCIAMDRQQDVRTLLNVKPTEEWMETMLHEMGHALYSRGFAPKLAYNLREEAHIFSTEAVAMLFGALVKNPLWLETYAGADPKKLKKVSKDIFEQRRREQLIFVRWGLVMFHFEQELYKNPDQDLNKIWYEMVERYQGLKKPAERQAPDWAAKIHFAIAPVYYHNYVLGELFAAQLRSQLVKMAKHQGPSSTLSFNGRKDFGEFFQEKIFKPGKTLKWPEFVKAATEQPLSPAAFVEELK